VPLGNAQPQALTALAFCRPCVVNIANIATARHYYSTDIMKIPQGGWGAGGQWRGVQHFGFWVGMGTVGDRVLDLSYVPPCLPLLLAATGSSPAGYDPSQPLMLA